MTIHTIECQPPWLHYIRDGKKPVEGRKGAEKYRVIKPGDQIRFFYGEDSFLATVEKIEEFDSILEYLMAVGLNNALPDRAVKTYEDGLQIYYQWSSPEQIKDLGFLGIWVRV